MAAQSLTLPIVVPKTDAEVVVRTLNWTTFLSYFGNPTPPTIASVEWSVSADSGLTVTAAGADTTRTSVKVTGGTYDASKDKAGNTHYVTATVTLTDTQVYARSFAVQMCSRVLVIPYDG